MITKRKRRIIILSVLLILILALIIWTVWGNTALQKSEYTISSDALPSAFDGYRIAHISDLHNTEIGNDNEKLVSMLKDSNPDIIAITGDLIDSRNTNVEIALKFAEEAVKIAPCYYVTGNHEARVSEYNELKIGLIELGVTVLENKEILIEKSGESIALLGVNDPSFSSGYLFGDSVSVMKATLDEIKGNEDIFTVLLSHRPELFNVYAQHNINLVLSGHAHGGQFRLPFVGGLVAPNQGFFPKYDAGLYTYENTNMIVSRGIGNSILPFRFNNRPEIIIIELNQEKYD